MKKGFNLFIAIIFIMVIVFTACSPLTEPTAVSRRNPFSLEIKGEDGMLVTWEGYRDGYQPGVTESTRLAVQNNSDQPWFGRICISLLEPRPSDVVLPLAERDFTLAPGEGFEDTVNFKLPPEHTPGNYGLTLVVQRPTGPSVSVTPIQIGSGGEQLPTDAWPTEVALEACQ